MTPERWAQVRELFEAALARPAAGRGEWLGQACAGDRELRREVDSLLAAHSGAGDFLESPAYQLDADQRSADQDRSLSGRQIGPYLVRHEIGRGGMGIVYLADDTRLSRRVALKTLGDDQGQGAMSRERLRHEARAAAALSHPSIATVYALEEIEGELYLASEYVPGQTLRALIARGPLPLAEVVDLAVQAARALAIAHAQGVVHRDIKPENIVRTSSGVVKILDFGVARLESFSGPRLTYTGAAVGTPAYMAPEQIRHGAVDFRTDLFALGLLIYEAASGANPFEAETATASIARILEIDLPALSQSCPTGLPALDRIVATCLRKDPNERYRSTQALVTELERVQEELARGSAATVVGDAPAAAAALRPAQVSARLWWDIHQVAASIVYALMIYPAWRARIWLAAPWQAVFFFSVVAAAVVTVAVRLHLVFTARHHPEGLAAERARARLLTLASDVLLSLSLLLAAVAIHDDHPEVASLLFSVGIATGVSRALIEPSTTRAAFGDQRSGS